MNIIAKNASLIFFHLCCVKGHTMAVSTFSETMMVFSDSCSVISNKYVAQNQSI